MCLYGMTLVLERQTTLCQGTSSLCFNKMTESFFKKKNKKPKNKQQQNTSEWTVSNIQHNYNDTAAVAVKSGGIVWQIWPWHDDIELQHLEVTGANWCHVTNLNRTKVTELEFPGFCREETHVFRVWTQTWCNPPAVASAPSTERSK